jgi:transglutaminase-like putative cysteine protease
MSAPSRLRLALRDLGAGAAFGSMAMSGQLPVWICGLFFFALVCALCGWRLFAKRSKLTALPLVALAGLLGFLVYAGQLDPVVAACSFAGLISGHRLLSSPDSGADGQVHLVSLLMVAGGAALSGELLFILFLVAFCAFASLSMGLGVVEAAVPQGEPLPVRSVVRPLLVGLVFALCGAAAFFILFPRLNWNMAARRASPGLGATTGLSDTVRLGGAGTLKSNPRVVVRAHITPDPSVEQLSAYWVARTYDTFDGQEWTSVGDPKRSRQRVTLRPGGEHSLHQRIELLPSYGARTLVALETPTRLGNAVAHSAGGSRRTSLVEMGGGEVRFVDAGLSYSYEATSLPPEEDASTPLTEAEHGQLLALPDRMDPRVAELARTVLAGEKEPQAAAQKLSAWLQRNYGYSLELGGEVDDPLADFLFVRKEGHCEHFATALTLMLRTQGISARLASGFFGGERADEDYLLRAGDAHAWTHVLVPGRGFITVDATPPGNRASQSLAFLQFLTGLYESLEGRWRSSVVDFSWKDQMSVAERLVRPPRESARSSARLPPLRIWVLALLAGAVTYALWSWFSTRHSAARPHAATKLVDTVERLLREAGVRPREGETLEELTARLAQEHHSLCEPLAPLTRRYLEARFGQRPLEAGEAERLLVPLRRYLEARRAASASLGQAPGRRAS